MSQYLSLMEQLNEILCAAYTNDCGVHVVASKTYIQWCIQRYDAAPYQGVLVTLSDGKLNTMYSECGGDIEFCDVLNYCFHGEF